MPAEIHPLQLTGAERSMVESASCQSRFDTGTEKIEASAYGRGAKAPAVATVYCVSHGSFKGNPVHHIVQCAREQGLWACEGEWIGMLVAVNADQLEVRVEGDIALAGAERIVQMIAGAGMFQGYSLRKALVPPCYVHQGTTHELIDVKCDGWHIIVSTWCPQSDCPRVFSIAKIGN